MTLYSLTEHGIFRPERVMWISPLTPQTSTLDIIKSKSLKKFLTRVEERCLEYGVKREISLLTQETYDIWRLFYVQKMTEQGHDIIARSDWLTEKLSMGKKVYGIRYTQNGDLVGGSVIVEDSDRVTMAYKASERIQLGNDDGANLGAVMEYDFLEFAKSKGKLASGGSSRNAFGVFNTLGYLAFKLRLGYMVAHKDSVAQHQSVPLSDNQSVLFFGTRSHEQSSNAEQSLQIFYCTSKPHDLKEISEIQSKIPKLEIISL